MGATSESSCSGGMRVSRADEVWGTVWTGSQIAAKALPRPRAVIHNTASAARVTLRNKLRDVRFMIGLRDLRQFMAHAGTAASARREFDDIHHCNSVSSLDDSVYGDQMENVERRCRLVVTYPSRKGF